VESYLSNEIEKLKKIVASRANIGANSSPNRHWLMNWKNTQKRVESFWSSTAASMFDINLKSEFVPYESNEDFW
jgi:hypothetical protein